MVTVRPSDVRELAEAMGQAGSAKRAVRLGGAFSKDAMAGPVAAAETTVSTCAMSRVLLYEPGDLTISVEAGMRWADLTSLLARDRQMIPLDPPFFHEATVGGVVAANTSGPRRRLYGGVRDVVIGMQFATLEGRLVQSGGMVVKNVAGLDMAKLMIGSFGTLAAIGSVNFKLTPAPETTRTFLQRFTSLKDAIAARDQLLRSVLQPAAVDLLNPAASERVGLSAHYSLLVQAAGIAEVLGRYQAELPRAEFIACEPLWTRIREFTPDWVRDHPEGCVVRLGTRLSEVGAALEHADGPALARAATGVVWLYAAQPRWNGFPGAVEFAPPAVKASADLWPAPGTALGVMRKVKALFDPDGILNPGRLYGRI
jgi:glycolate oxidase FAD binding subunit